MSELNDAYFARLAQKMPGMKQQIATKRAQQIARGNGACGKKPCGLCGKFFGGCGQTFQTKMYCPACQGSLNKGCAGFVTLEKPARFWLGKGTKPEFAGKVTVISKEQMDAILKIEADLKAKDAAIPEVVRRTETDNGQQVT